MDKFTVDILTWDMDRLTPAQIQYLHDLKSEAFKLSLAAEFAKMKART